MHTTPTRIMRIAGALLLAVAMGRAPMDARRQSGIISGVVVGTDAAATPIPRVIVTLTGATTNPIGAVTDSEGRFTFTGLPAGRFAIAASKPAYITTAYGAKRPGRAGTEVTIAAGATVGDLRIALPKGGAITGTVRNHAGEPVPGIEVKTYIGDLSSRDSMPIQSVDSVVTDDRGVYRAYGLPPGEYYVLAIPGVAGGGTAFALTPAEIDAALREARERRGRAPGSAAVADAAPPATVGYAPVFHPSGTMPSEAVTIPIGVGEERAGIDVTLDVVPMATIEGVIHGATNGATMIISGAGRPGPLNMMLAPRIERRPGPDGRFKYFNVAPGRYTLTARTTTLWASTEVVVRGANVTGVSLQMAPTLSVSGQLRFEGRDWDPATPLTQIRVGLALPADRTGGGSSGLGETQTAFGGSQRAVTAQVRDDGTFELPGLVPGPYLATATLPSSQASTWWLRSVMVDGRDILDGPFEMSANNVRDAVVTFSNRHTELTGTLQNAEGAPVPGHFVVVLPADRALWTATRRIRVARPDTTGRFSFQDLPPGSYLLAAASDVDSEDLKSPTLLAELAAAGVAVVLAEGGTTTQTIRTSRPPVP